MAVTVEIWLLATVAAVYFVSTLTRSTFGFGDALVSMPLLALLIGLEDARPLGALVSVCTAVLIVARDWRHIDMRSTRRLVVAALVGMPLGELALTRVDERIAKAVLAVALIAFSSYCLLRPNLKRVIGEGWVWLSGFCAGALGIAFNTPGPPLVVYGTLRHWQARQFRATLQGYFLPTGTVVLLRHVVGQRYDSRLMWMFAAALPCVLLAVPLGRMLHEAVRGRGFERYVYVLLMLVAAMLLATAIWGGGAEQ